MLPTRYLCSLPNIKGTGTAREIFDADPAAIAEFVRREDVPGRGVYYCIGELAPGVRRRCKENVIALPGTVCDLDLRKTSRERMLLKLKQLALPPDEIRDSGRGLHAIWWFKEPVTDEAGMAEAEAEMKEIAELLGGDPIPTHRAALLRLPGTHNSKAEGSPVCRIIWRANHGREPCMTLS